MVFTIFVTNIRQAEMFTGFVEVKFFVQADQYGEWRLLHNSVACRCGYVNIYKYRTLHHLILLLNFFFKKGAAS